MSGKKIGPPAVLARLNVIVFQTTKASLVLSLCRQPHDITTAVMRSKKQRAQRMSVFVCVGVLGGGQCN